MNTVAETVANTAGALAPRAGADARFEAALIVSALLDYEPAELPARGAELFPGKFHDKLHETVARRLAGEPLQYLLGKWEFMGLPFIVRPCALIPRQDTEALCEAALEERRGRHTLLDLCCGTGCIGISLAKLGGFVPTFADISPDCLALAKENAALNGVNGSFVQADMFNGITGRFDAICCNPPYIPTGELASLQEEVHHEPALALDGGADGLDFYRRIARGYGEHLAPNGMLLMEVGVGQAADVIKIFGHGRTVCDLCGIERVVVLS